MNMHQPITPSQAAFHEAAKARAMRKLEAAKKLTEPKTIAYFDDAPKLSAAPASRVAIKQKHLVVDRQPEWKTKAISFDAHIKQWLLENGELQLSCKEYIRLRAVELAIDYETLIGPNRGRAVVAARHLVMWEVKTFVKPHMSFPELGRVFGGRDHTSALFAVTKISLEMSKKQGVNSENVIPIWYKNRTKKERQLNLGSNQSSPVGAPNGCAHTSTSE
jgi:hypothetical protein